MYVGKAHVEITGGGLGLFELASLDEATAALGAAVSSSSSSGTAAASANRARTSALAARRSRRWAAARSSRAAWSLTMTSRSAASSLGLQHFLYFLPLPQWQGSLRPGLAMAVNTLIEEDASLVLSPAGGCHLPRAAVGL